MVHIFKINEEGETVAIKSSFKQAIKFIIMKYGKVDSIKVISTREIDFYILDKKVKILKGGWKKLFKITENRALH